MPDTSVLVGGRRTSSRPLVCRGIVVRPPTSVNDAMTVALQNFSRAYSFDIPSSNWEARGMVLPAQHARCVVLFDDDGDAWVPVWEGNSADLATQAELDAVNAALGALDTRVDTLEAPRLGSGQVVGQEGVDSGSFTSTGLPGTKLFGDAAATQPIRLGPITPSFDCWWPVEISVLAKTLDALWNYMNFSPLLMDSTFTTAKADALGRQFAPFPLMHHSGAASRAGLFGKMNFALAAGESYGVHLIASTATGGTWQYYRGGNGHTFIQSTGIVPR